MTNADRLVLVNRWYDDVPDDWRSHVLLWPLIGAGFINMQLSIAAGFPFGLLVLLTMAGFAALRAPILLGWIKPGPDGARLEVGRIDALYDINRLYDRLPELPRMLVFPLVLIAAGTLNMWLTYRHGWPFGLLLLLAVFGLLALRLPYHWKLITPPPPAPAKQASELVLSWMTCASNWYDGLPNEAKLWGTVAGFGAVAAFDIVVTGGYRVPLCLLIVVEMLVIFAMMMVRALRESSVGSATTFRDKIELFRGLWEQALAQANAFNTSGKPAPSYADKDNLAMVLHFWKTAQAKITHGRSGLTLQQRMQQQSASARQNLTMLAPPAPPAAAVLPTAPPALPPEAQDGELPASA